MVAPDLKCMGLQSVFEDVLGTQTMARWESFCLPDVASFKVVAHIMPDLPNVGIERDVEGFIVSL